MKNHSPGTNKFPFYLWIVVIGSGVGWLIGLSVSPVVSIVITSVTGSAAALAAAIGGFAQESTEERQSTSGRNQWKINPAPLAALILGLVVGSLIGIYVRNSSLLGSDISIEMRKWSKAGLVNAGVSEQEIIKRIFDSQYPSNVSATSQSSSRPIPLGGTVLFSVSTDQCDTLLKALLRSDEELRKALMRIKQLENLPTIVEDPTQLRAIVEEVICL